jgi:hypothetical protein
VRAELESHFREGLIELIDQGLEFEQAVRVLGEEFGAPKLTAALIRRGKKRGRPMIWKVFVNTVAVTALGAGSVGGYIGWLFASKPNPTVDYLEIINEPVQAVPVEDRAWPMLAQVLLQLEPLPEGLRGVVRSEFAALRPGSQHWPAASEWLESNRPLIPLVSEAAHESVWGFVYSSEDSRRFILEHAKLRGDEVDEDSLVRGPGPLDPPTISIRLPALSDMRELGWLLALESRAQAAAGDFAAAWKSVDTAYRLGVLLTGGQTLIEQLVGTTITNVATAEMRSLLQGAEDDMKADAFEAALAESLIAQPPVDLAPNYLGEALMFKDAVQYLFTDDGQGNGRLIPEQYAKIDGVIEGSRPELPKGVSREAYYVAVAALHADRQETLAKWDEVWNRMSETLALPLYEPRRARYTEPIERLKADPLEKQRFALVLNLTADLGRADQLIREAGMNIRATYVAAALTRYRLAHNGWPVSLADLVPEYISEVPEDAYSGLPLRYFVDEEGRIRLYSFGRNLRDDGGSSAEMDGATADIVYWPTARN